MWCTPKGSVLGPLLFLLYIIDIPNSSSLFKFTLFADDTSLFYSSKNKQDSEQTINTELHKVAAWLSANKLSLNVSKSKLLIYSHTLNNKTEPKLLINNEQLNEVDNAKYLGVILDNKLNWHAHINSIALRLSKGIGLLAKIRHYVPESVLRSLYFTFINPYIEYNLINWGTAPHTELDLINKKLKKVIRIISFKDREHPSLPLFQNLEILPLDLKFKLSQAKFMWKLENNLLPTSLSVNFKKNMRNQYINSLSRLASLSKHIKFSGINLWKSLPVATKNKPSLKSFSKSLKLHYLHSMN